jgi:hypothetical protein
MSTLYFLTVSTATYMDRVLENAFGCLIGSAVAIIISILIYQRGNRSAYRAEENQRLANEALLHADELNQMRAFRVLLQRSIRTSEIWSEGIKKFITELKEHPVEFPLLLMTSIANLKRIIDAITVEKTGRTYMKHFPSENSANEFISILESVDYLYAEFNQLPETVKRASLNHNDRMIQVSEKLDAADELILENLEEMGDSQLSKDIQNIKTNFAKNRGEISDIHSVNELYFIPMRDLMQKVLESNFMNEFVKNYTYAITKGIQFYSYVGNGYDRFRDNMVELETKIITNTETLRTRAERILQSDLA